MLTRVRPRYWIPTMEASFWIAYDRSADILTLVRQAIWAILTFGLCKCNSATQIYILRFFVGKAITSPILRRCNLECFECFNSDMLWWRACWEHLLPRYAVYYWVLVVSWDLGSSQILVRALETFRNVANSDLSPNSRKDELAKRSCIFHTSSALGSMFSGYLMAGVYNLDGRGGFKGWQWCLPHPSSMEFILTQQ